MEYISEINKNLFSDIIIYTIAEPGAMGAANLMEFVNKKGKCFMFTLGEEIEYSELKKLFPALKDCFWNGPSADNKNDGEILLFTNNDAKNSNCTRVSKGWHHIYTGCGNHLVVKEEYYLIFSELIKDFESPVDIGCDWYKVLDNFFEKIN